MVRYGSRVNGRSAAENKCVERIKLRKHITRSSLGRPPYFLFFHEGKRHSGSLCCWTALRRDTTSLSVNIKQSRMVVHRMLSLLLVLAVILKQ